MNLLAYYPASTCLLQEKHISITSFENKFYNKYSDHLFQFQNQTCSVIVLNGKLHGKLTIEVHDNKKEIWFNRGIIHRDGKPAYIHKRGKYTENQVYIKNGYLEDVVIYGEMILDSAFLFIVDNGRLDRWKMRDHITCQLSSFILGIRGSNEPYIHEFDESEFNIFDNFY